VENNQADPNGGLNLPNSNTSDELCDISDDQAEELYQLSQDKDRVTRLMRAKGRRSLDAEEAMLRALLEIRWNSGDHEATAGRGLSGLISEVKDMVVANANLAHKRGTVLEQSQVTELAKGILSILTEAGEKFVPQASQQKFLAHVSTGVAQLIKKAIS
jgi:hypothetical protein